MATARAEHPIKYQLAVQKSDLDNLRYGRKKADGTRPPSPFLKPWTIETIMQRSMNFYTNKTDKQVLIPTSVIDSEAFFIITGTLSSKDGNGDEKKEHELFIKNNKYHEEDNVFQLASCYWEMPPKLFGLFDDKAPAFGSLVKTILNDITSDVVGQVQWKYNKDKNIAWLPHDSAEILEKVAVHFANEGYERGQDIFIGRDDKKQLGIMIKHLDTNKLTDVPRMEIGKSPTAGMRK
jgi:hypothetical protein